MFSFYTSIFFSREILKSTKNMSGLQGKVVIITGASSGIGEASAIDFAKKGCKIVLVARREELLKEVEKKV